MLKATFIHDVVTYKTKNWRVTVCVIRDYPDPTGKAFPIFATLAQERAYWEGRVPPAEPELVAKGYAICSPRDQYVRKKGNLIAKGRAYTALTEMKSSNPLVGKRFSKMMSDQPFFLCQYCGQTGGTTCSN